MTRYTLRPSYQGDKFSLVGVVYQGNEMSVPRFIIQPEGNTGRGLMPPTVEVGHDAIFEAVPDEGVYFSPWSLHESVDYWSVTDARGTTICKVQPVYSNEGDYYRQRRSVAALLVAAPKLLELLLAVAPAKTKDDGIFEFGRELFNKIREIINPLLPKE